jgi:hypothetical protein
VLALCEIWCGIIRLAAVVDKGHVPRENATLSFEERAGQTPGGVGRSTLFGNWDRIPRRDIGASYLWTEHRVRTVTQLVFLCFFYNSSRGRINENVLAIAKISKGLASAGLVHGGSHGRICDFSAPRSGVAFVLVFAHVPCRNNALRHDRQDMAERVTPEREDVTGGWPTLPKQHLLFPRSPFADNRAGRIIPHHISHKATTNNGGCRTSLVLSQRLREETSNL